jgi:hypothetical protein
MLHSLFFSFKGCFFFILQLVTGKLLNSIHLKYAAGPFEREIILRCSSRQATPLSAIRACHAMVVDRRNWHKQIVKQKAGPAARTPGTP